MDVSRDTPMEGDKVYRMYRYKESKEGHRDIYEPTVGSVSSLQACILGLNSLHVGWNEFRF